MLALLRAAALDGRALTLTLPGVVLIATPIALTARTLLAHVAGGGRITLPLAAIRRVACTQEIP
jgi:hypothetical protein